jgi:hypothetical protein
MQQKARRRLGWILAIGIFGTLALYLVRMVEREGARIADHFTPTVERGPARMWLDTPEVSPGGAIHARVATEGGLASRIVLVRASAGAAVVAASGADPWGDSIKTDSHHDNEDELELDVRVPDDAAPGESIRVTADVDVEIAAEAAPANFRNESHHEVLDARIEVVTARDLALRRVWRGAWASGLLLLISVVAALFGRRLRCGLRNDVVVIGFLAAMAMAFFADLAFVRPFGSAAGLHGGWATGSLSAVWVGMPVLAFVLGRRRASRASTLPAVEVVRG